MSEAPSPSQPGLCLLMGARDAAVLMSGAAMKAPVDQCICIFMVVYTCIVCVFVQFVYTYCS